MLKYLLSVTVWKFLILFNLFLLISCQEKGESSLADEEPSNDQPGLFERLSSKVTGIEFMNQIQNEEDFNIFRYRNFYNGAGVGIGDINNDGLPDIYLTSNMGENKLYLNKGDFKFEDISESSGTAGKKAWSTGVTMVDINNDGFLDIYVSNAGDIEGEDRRNELFINNGDLSFTEAAADYQLDENGFTTHAAFFDYDGDGDLDVYILNNSFIPVSSLGYNNKRELRAQDWNMPEIFKGGGDKLLQNNNGVFEDVSQEAGIYGSLIGFGLGVTIGDVNNDLLPDIYVSNDFYERDYLYLNNGDGSFSEAIKSHIDHLSLSSMGADMADINNDSYPEIFVTDMLPENDERLKNTSDFERYDIYKLKEQKDFYHQFMQNTLQLNDGKGEFSEIAFYSGVAQTDWSWGALVFDMDNDGFKDIFVSNGIYHDLTNQDFMDFFANDILQQMVLTGKKKEFDSILNRMPSTPISNYAFKNQGDLRFINQSNAWGLDKPSFSNGAAYADLNNDGDLDLVVNNVNQEVFIYRNQTSETLQHNFLKIKLDGSSKNRFAIGSKVMAYTGQEILTQELIPTRGFQSSIDYPLVLGLGKREKIDSLKVIWPDGNISLLEDPELNKDYGLNYEDSRQPEKMPETKENTPQKVKKISHNLQVHREENYVDYDYEGLINQMLSREGPALAVTDVNGDGNDDFFIGGAKDQPGRLYLQSTPGKFKAVTNPVFDRHNHYEDTFAVFADLNGNNLPDLIVGSGGNRVDGNRDNYRPRIYLNQGQGKFEPSPQDLPGTGHNTSVISPVDYDWDGDVDLFIGSRSVPGIYGINPRHQLLENDGKGNFTDITDAKAYFLNEIGMVTDAAWSDINGDNKVDLILVGDWISPQVYINTEDSFTKMETNLHKLSGSWNTLKLKDLNGNGQKDIILGNRGTNSFYKASSQNPVKVYINDFDDNGTIEQIFTRRINDKDVPIHLRRELSAQISSVKKQNLKFSEYATQAIDDLFSREVLENSIVREITEFNSVIAWNNGEGKFSIDTLPREVQFSSVHAIALMEPQEGKTVMLMGGNDFDLKPQFSRFDASNGIWLEIKKDGSYQIKPNSKTGFNLSGQVKEIRVLNHSEGEKFILVAINNQAPELFKIR
ncbi:VCBS repeat-containing protein [Salegentibacter sp. F14]